jgi:hypothetical protein
MAALFVYQHKKTHILQPLDIAVFKSIKVVWKETVDK